MHNVFYLHQYIPITDYFRDLLLNFLFLHSDCKCKILCICNLNVSRLHLNTLEYDYNCENKFILIVLTCLAPAFQGDER